MRIEKETKTCKKDMTQNKKNRKKREKTPHIIKSHNAERSKHQAVVMKN